MKITQKESDAWLNFFEQFLAAFKDVDPDPEPDPEPDLLPCPLCKKLPRIEILGEDRSWCVTRDCSMYAHIFTQDTWQALASRSLPFDMSKLDLMPVTDEWLQERVRPCHEKDRSQNAYKELLLRRKKDKSTTNPTQGA